MHDTLLLIIDMQNAYLPKQPWQCANILDIIPKIQTLCENFNRNYDIVFTRFIASKNPVGTWLNYNIKYDDINQSTFLNEIISNFKPYLEEYPVVDKSTYSCYKNDILKELIDSHKKVAICGVVADCCILSTALDIIDVGKPLIYLQDAIGEYKQNSGKAVLDIMDNMKLHVNTIHVEDFLH
ncbi:MAG: cysteine hydrolase [Ruminococcus sp.]|nr:cysteine hydrolase [Ruminococcus sp.]MCD7799752.1 cysteine hydrolase [Ruminococcus sp.]